MHDVFLLTCFWSISLSNLHFLSQKLPIGFQSQGCISNFMHPPVYSFFSGKQFLTHLSLFSLKLSLHAAVYDPCAKSSTVQTERYDGYHVYLAVHKFISTFVLDHFSKYQLSQTLPHSFCVL